MGQVGRTFGGGGYLRGRFPVPSPETSNPFFKRNDLPQEQLNKHPDAEVKPDGPQIVWLENLRWHYLLLIGRV